MPRKILLRNRRRIRGFENDLDKIYFRAQTAAEKKDGTGVLHQEQALTEPQDYSYVDIPSPQFSTVQSVANSISSSSDTESDKYSSTSTSDSESSFPISELGYQIPDEDWERNERISDGTFGLHLLIANVLQAANLHEKNQKRFYCLFKILINCCLEILPYKNFKAILYNLAPITSYKFSYCFEHQSFIDPSNVCCAQYEKHGKMVVFSLLDTIKYIINNNINYLLNSHSSWNNFHQPKLYQDLLKNQSKDDDTIRLTLLINADDAQMIKSSKVSTTPVPFTIAELPNHRRLTKDNVFNLGIYHGPKSFPSSIIVLVVPFKYY